MWDKIKRAIGKSKAPTPQSNDPKINDDWAVNDIAECICSGPWVCAGTLQPMSGPKKGERYRVTGVGILPVQIDGSRRWFITLSGWHRGFEASGFRKVIPKHDKIEESEKAVTEGWFKKRVKA